MVKLKNLKERMGEMMEESVLDERGDGGLRVEEMGSIYNALNREFSKKLMKKFVADSKEIITFEEFINFTNKNTSESP